ncbi:type II secretion system major pseudopilin GspG [Candidatus Halobeggiatoa sp. HSG11]|nr:type II secretion system major pseudopilin GspG [Candidatus Halobeggiatoa sp. HSG11]
MLSSNKGFTLIELLIVMAILGMLAALVGPSLFNKVGEGRINAAATQMSSMEVALDAYRLDMFKYPSSLEALVKNSSSNSKWQGPYMKKGIPKDPWGNEYQYKKPGREGRDYDLYSFGADGRDGGEKEDADVLNWKTD